MPFAYLLLALQTAAPAPAPAPTPVPAAPERKVCRSEAPTGSILPGKRVCHTRAEWTAIDAQRGQDVDTFRSRSSRSLGRGDGG